MRIINSRKFELGVFISQFIILLSIFYIFVIIIPDLREDILQGDLYKIMYVHVPSAWLSLFCYSFSALFALVFLVKKIRTFVIVSRCYMILAVISSFVTITTGAIWGKPAWGTWWVWDSRLTSMFFLFVISCCSIVIGESTNNKELNGKLFSIFTLFGFIDIPIIKFSVDVWSTIHQPASVLRISGISIHSHMFFPLVSVFFLTLLFVHCVIFVMIKCELNYLKIESRGY